MDRYYIWMGHCSFCRRLRIYKIWGKRPPKPCRYHCIAFHINNFDSSFLPVYLIAQLTGAFIGAIIVWMTYKQHFDVTDDGSTKLAVFLTAPAIRNPFYNLITEIVGTFILVFGAMAMSAPEIKLGTLDALPVGLLVLGIGLSLRGTNRICY